MFLNGIEQIRMYRTCIAELNIRNLDNKQKMDTDYLSSLCVLPV